MARPFRFGPPAPADGGIARERAGALVARRHDVRLVAVVAGPGFGKTSLLAASTRQRTDDALVDVWLTCEPADASGDHLLRDLAAAIGLDPGATVADLVDQVWRTAPSQVCFILDDVHEIPPRSEGADLLSTLLLELPANGRVVMGSRHPVPVPTARLAASGQLVRVGEAELVFDESETEAFAAARGIAPALLTRTGGWPALAELTATAGSELVLDYLWEEVLAKVGPERARDLARFAVVGGGDDEIARALGTTTGRVDDLVDGLPLVQRAPGGASLHPLWIPPLRGLLEPDEVDDARRRAAAVHHGAGHYSLAIDLHAESEAWPEVLRVMRDAAVRSPVFRSPTSVEMPRVDFVDYARWYAILPAAWRDRPAARLASGLVRRSGDPRAALPDLQAATAGLRAAGDLDGEAAAIAAHALILMWVGDVAGIGELYGRALELADAGSSVAIGLRTIGAATLAHLVGDSAGVFAAVREIAPAVLPDWVPVLLWFEAVAHRRDGRLDVSMETLRRARSAAHGGRDDPNLAHHELRARWLLGDVDAVCREYEDLAHRFRVSGDEFNAIGAAVEHAGKQAWLGRAVDADDELSSVEALFRAAPGPMGEITWAIARAAIHVARGEEEEAAVIVAPSDSTRIDGPNSWFWWDRGATALVRVLHPETADVWRRAPLGPPHLTALQLAEVLEAARGDALGPVRALDWPSAGEVRSCLPLPWVIELVAAAAAAGTPAHGDLVRALGPALPAGLRTLATGTGPIAEGARQLLGELPVPPDHTVRVEVLGPLSVRRDGEAVTAPELRRRRVRELLGYLVAHRRVRREEVTEALWPDRDDRGRNLRVTLTYLQRVLQPDRREGEQPYFVRTAGAWIELEQHERLEVDVWLLEEHLEEASRAERERRPAAALEHYLEALPLWRGEPHADHPYADWAERERARLRSRYAAAVGRAAELLLAGGDAAGAVTAAQRAVAADPTDEAAHQRLVRCHVAAGDKPSARAAVDACEAALRELGVPASEATQQLAVLVGTGTGDPRHDPQ